MMKLIFDLIEVGPIVEQLIIISDNLSKPDWLGLVNIVLVPASIWLTAVITSRQSMRLIEQESQHKFEQNTYKDTRESLLKARKIYSKDSSSKIRMTYSLKNFISSHYEIDPKNPEIGEFKNYSLDEYINLSNELANTLMTNSLNITDYKNTLIDLQSFFSDSHSVYINFQNLIDFLNTKRKKNITLSGRVKMIHLLGKTSTNKIDLLFNDIFETIDPSHSDLFSDNWKALISALNHRKVGNKNY